jgi:predicted transposase YdaD
MQTFDKLWKGIIEDLFEEFLYFFYSPWIDQIDLKKGFKFLDQELAQLFPEADQDNRVMDKLVQVYLKNGKKEWILIHIEVQGYADLTFAKRMYTSQYRILDRYQKQVSAIAILTDKKKDFHPKVYHSECFGAEVLYRFNTYKVLDQDVKALETSDNPFAIVILATLMAIKKGKKSDMKLMNIKTDLVKLLFQRNYSKISIQKILYFINYYVRFENQENYDIFAEEINAIHNKNNKNMGVREIIIEEFKEAWKTEGKLEGLNEGKLEGLNEGKLEGLSEKEIEKNHNFTISLLENCPEWSDEKIAKIVGVEVEYVTSLRFSISENSDNV